jgi:hypothetical protein
MGGARSQGLQLKCHATMRMRGVRCLAAGVPRRWPLSESGVGTWHGAGAWDTLWVLCEMPIEGWKNWT